MEIATILSSHTDTALTVNTIESIRKWVGTNCFVVVDGSAWNSWGKDASIGPKLQGLIHNCPISPHRNIVLGLMNAFELWPNADWFCHTEYDVYFGNDSFKDDLKDADERGVWCIGNDYREENYNMSFLEQMLHIKIEGSKYLLGCCVFLNGKFVRKLAEIGFFSTFLRWTNPFEQGFIPFFEGFSFIEHLFPTLAHYYGGKVEQFAKWNERMLLWEGNFKKYPMRFRPDLDPNADYFSEAAIMHPIKDVMHPFRMMYKRKSNGKRIKI